MARRLYEAIHPVPQTQTTGQVSQQLSAPPSLPATQPPVTLPTTQSPVTLPATQPPVTLPTTQPPVTLPATQPPLSSAGLLDLALLLTNLFIMPPPIRQYLQPSHLLRLTVTLMRMPALTTNSRHPMQPTSYHSCPPLSTSNFLHPAWSTSPAPLSLTASSYLNQLRRSRLSKCNTPSSSQCSKSSHHSSSQPHQWYNIQLQYCNLQGHCTSQLHSSTQQQLNISLCQYLQSSNSKSSEVSLLILPYYCTKHHLSMLHNKPHNTIHTRRQPSLHSPCGCRLGIFTCLSYLPIMRYGH